METDRNKSEESSKQRCNTNTFDINREASRSLGLLEEIILITRVGCCHFRMMHIPKVYRASRNIEMATGSDRITMSYQISPLCHRLEERLNKTM